MDWVKLTTDYYRDLAVALGDDAMEVMFTRGLGLAGEIEQSGFIPDAFLVGLTRRPALARKTAQRLVKADLWARVSGGYQVVNWAEIQAELERLVEKKRRDKERKRRARSDGMSVDVSAPASVDTSTDNTPDSAGLSAPASAPVSRGPSLRSLESELDAAAAAREAPNDDDPIVPEADLPGELAILRIRLDAANLRVRWNKLSRSRVDRIVELQRRHGDSVLVTIAKQSWRPDSPPQFAQAWLGHWEAHDQAASTGRGITGDPCPVPGHSGTTTHCAGCAADQKAAR